MKLVISEKQLEKIIAQINGNQDLKEEGEGEGAPEAGTSSDGEKKTGASKWESGATRGPANQIGVTKWVDSYKITRGKANPLSEQRKSYDRPLNVSRPTAGSDYFASVSAQNRQRAEMKYKTGLTQLSKHVYKEDDGENFFLNLGKGEFSEALLDLRSFMFSGWGLATQIVVGVVGAEVGAPVVLTAIDAGIVLNDLYIFSEQGMDKVPPDNIRTPWERFKWLLTNNPDFLRVAEDVIFIATLGTVRGASNVIKYFSKSSNGVGTFITLLKTVGTKIQKGIAYVPGKLGKWLTEKSSSIKKVSDFFDTMQSGTTKTARAVGRIPKAFYVSAVTLLGFEIGLRTLSFILNLGTTISPKNITDEMIASKGGAIEKMVSEKNKLIADRKKVEDEFFNVLKTFPKYKNLARTEFSLTNLKKDNETIFIISGVKYYINANMEIQKI